MTRKHVSVAVAVTATICFAATCGSTDEQSTSQNTPPQSASN